jgi:DDE_Tnp_1-associated/Transposase DDE domain
MSLMEVFATLPDPRKARGRVHPLPAILGLAVVAMLAGHTTYQAIAQFGRDHGKALAFALGFRRGKTPAKSTFSEIFRAVDIDRFEAALHQWLQGRLDAGWRQVAIDGKTLRGSGDGEVPAVHLLAAYVPAAAAVIGQLRVDATTNEHKAALRLLAVLPLAGAVVTGDAMFTHRDTAQTVLDGGGDYLLVVKDNQSELKAQIDAALNDDAAFSPLPAAAEGGRGTDGAIDRQGTWAAGAAAADEYDRPERVRGLAGGGSSL